MKPASTLREITTLVGGNALAQLIALGAYFVLTRIYTPDDFGLFNIFYSYIEVLIIASTCKYELAIVVAEGNREAQAVGAFALRLNALISSLLLAIAAVLWLCHALPARYDALGWMVLLIPPMVYCCGTSRIYGALLNRLHRYRTLAASETANAATSALLKTALGLLRLHDSGMPIGTVAGRGAANLYLRHRLHREGLFPSAPRADRHAAAIRFSNYPRFVATKDFINSLSSALPVLWLGVHFSHAEVGLFGLALTFTFRPANLLNVAFEQVLYARTAEAVRRRESVMPSLRRFLLVINAVALPVCAAAYWLAEPLFGFCFGGKWSGCGPYVRALLPWVYIMLSSTSLMFISNVFGTQRTEFYFYLALLALRVAAIVAGLHADSFLLGIRLYSAAGATVALALQAWYLWQVHRYELRRNNPEQKAN